MVNNRRITEILFRYGTDTKAGLAGNQAIVNSLNTVRKAADDEYNALVRAQEAAKSAGSLGGIVEAGNRAYDARIGLLNSIQDRERASLETNKQLAEVFKTQNNTLANRLKFAEQGDLAGLRNSIAGGSQGGGFSLGAGGGAATAGGRGELGRGISKFSRGLFNLPDVQLTPGISTTVLSRLGLVAGGAAEGIGLTVTQLGLMGVVAAPLALGLAKIVGEMQEAQRIATAFAQAQAKVNQLVAGGATTDELTAVRDNAIAQQEGLRKTAEEGQAALDAFLALSHRLPEGVSALQVLTQGLPPDYAAQLDQASAVLKDFFGIDIGGAGGLRAVESAIEGMKNQANELNPEIAAATLQMQSQEVAQNNLAAAYEEATKRLQDNADVLAQRATQIDVQGANNAIEAQRLTTEQRDAAVDSLQEEITVLEHYRDTHELTEDAARQLAVRLDDLRERSKTLSETTLSYADVQAQLNQQLEDSLSGIQNAIASHQALAAAIRTSTVEQVADRLSGIKEEQAAIQEFLPDLRDLAPTSKEAALALAEAELSLQDLSDEFLTQAAVVLPAALSRAATQLNTDLAKIRTEGNERLTKIDDERIEAEGEALSKRTESYLEAEDKRGDAINDIAEKQAQARAKIERKSNATIANAIFARDALAAYLAKQQKAEELEELRIEGENRAKEVDKRYKDERDQADDNYRKSLQQAQEAANKSIRLERARQTAEIAERQSAYGAQLALLSQFNISATGQIASFVNNANNSLAGLNGNIAQTPINTNAITQQDRDRQRAIEEAYRQYYAAQGYGNSTTRYRQATPFAAGGMGQGLMRLNDGSGFESWLYQKNKLVTATEPVRIFSAEDTRQMLSGSNGRGGINIPITINGSMYSKRKIMDIVDETLADTIPDDWDE